MKVKNDHRSIAIFQFKQLERRSLKKKNQGFNGIRTRDLRVGSIRIKCKIVTFEFYNRSPPTQRFFSYLSHLDQQSVEE